MTTLLTGRTAPRPEPERRTIRFLGKDVDPLAKDAVNGALGDAMRLMHSTAYLDAGDVFHDATVARVSQLFEIAFPNEIVR